MYNEIETAVHVVKFVFVYTKFKVNTYGKWRVSVVISNRYMYLNKIQRSYDALVSLTYKVRSAYHSVYKIKHKSNKTYFKQKFCKHNYIIKLLYFYHY